MRKNYQINYYLQVKVISVKTGTTVCHHKSIPWKFNKWLIYAEIVQ